MSLSHLLSQSISKQYVAKLKNTKLATRDFSTLFCRKLSVCNPGGAPSITQNQIHWKHKSIFCHYFQNIFSDSEININLSLPSLPEQNVRCQKEKCAAINNKLHNKCHWRQSFIVGTTWNIQVEFVKQPIKIYIEVDVKSWRDINVIHFKIQKSIWSMCRLQLSDLV